MYKMLFRKSMHLATVFFALLCATIPFVAHAQSQGDTQGQQKVFLPFVSSQQQSSVIQEMASMLPSGIDCVNCFTREAFLAQPAEELARIEQSEKATQAIAYQLQQQDQFLNELVINNQIDNSEWPSVEELSLMTPDEVAQTSAAQRAILQSFVTNSDLNSLQAMNGSVSIATLPAANITDNINSCGPASIRVALSVRKATNLIASIDTIGNAVDKNSNGTQGNWKNGLESEDIPRMATYLNTQLGFGASNPYYSSKSSDSATTFRARAETTINNNLAMIFGTKSLGLPDWTSQSNHIVTAYAVTYDAQKYTVISWADTAPIVSGHYKVVNGKAVTGAYNNSRRTTDLWFLASGNNFQISN